MRTRSRHVAVLVFDEVELQDVSSLVWVLSAAGRHWNWRPFSVELVGERAGLVTTRDQVQLQVSQTFHTCPAPEVLVVPGGFGARLAARSEPVQSWLRAVAPGAEHWLCLGLGAGVLGATGLLPGKSVASSPPLDPWLQEACTGSHFVTTGVGTGPVVSSAPLLSAAQTVDAPELALALVEKCLGPGLTQGLRTHLSLTQTTLRVSLPPKLI